MVKTSKEEYNNEPVLFCTCCLSLRIKSLEGMIDYCDDCGQTNIRQTHIDHWEELYEEKYGKKYINKPIKKYK